MLWFIEKRDKTVNYNLNLLTNKKFKHYEKTEKLF